MLPMYLTWTGMVILVSSFPMHCLRNDHRFSSDFSGCATGSVVRHAEYSSAGLLSSCCKNGSKSCYNCIF